MSNQFEQFRDLCAKTAEGNYDPNATFDQKEASVVMARYLCAKMIRALPLPVMPEQDAEVMPEQAEPVTPDKAKVLGYIVYAENGNVRIWYKAKNHNRALDEASENAWSLQPINIDEENSALLARIAHLEQEEECSEAVIKKFSTILADICLTLKGERTDGVHHSYHDLAHLVSVQKLANELYQFKVAELEAENAKLKEGNKS